VGKIISLLMSLIAYFCVATVITIALIVGYLRHTEQLTNDKMFRLVAVMQDVDLQQIAKNAEKDPNEVPPEEPSLGELQHRQQVQDRNYEVKQLALQRGKQAFEASYQQLVEQTARYDRIAKDWQSRLKQEQELTSQQNLARVVNQLEQVSPDVGKKQLMMWIEEQKMDDAILLMSQMSENKLSKILKTFETPEELKQLHEIHQRILSSSVANETLQKALEELDALDGKKVN
jgi:hypothetical protein